MTKQKSPSTESNNPNASRLRDNQRRSRARKKEYVATLEAKYQECQRMGVEASIEIQNAARAVVKENSRLRELLKKIGLADDEIDKWLTDGGLENSVVDRVQNGLGRRPCPPLEGGIEGCCGKPGSRAEMLARRSSTGGMLMKVNTSQSTLQRRASIMPDTTSPMLAARTAAMQKTPSPLKTQLQLQTSHYTSPQGYPTPTMTATPTSATSSPYCQATSLPLTRPGMTATSTSGYNPHSPLHIASTTAATFATLTSSTTSPPILPGAVTGWNNFQIQPQLPPPALSPTVLNAYVQAQQQQHQAQQQQRLQAGSMRPLQHLQQQQQQQQHYQYSQQHQQEQQHQQQLADHSRATSHIIEQFHHDGMTADMQEELCPGRTHNSQSPIEQQSAYSFQQPQQRQCQPRSSPEQCCGGLIDCPEDDEDELADDGSCGSANGYDSGDGISMDGMGNSSMGLAGMGSMDISGGRGCGNSDGQGTGQGNISACSVDNAVLFGMLNRMVG